MFANSSRLTRRVLEAFAIAVIPLLLISAPSLAADTNGPSCTTDDGSPGVRISISVGGTNCVPVNSNTTETNPIVVYALAILNVLSGLVGLAVVGGLVWGGILYMSARADSGQIEKAKMVMFNSVVGLVLFVFMYAILQFIIPGGLFNGS